MKLSDKELIERCLRKDLSAWDEFIRRFSNLIRWAIDDRLRRWGSAVNAADIQDIYQEVLVSLYSKDKLSQLRNADKIVPWLAVVSGNTAINFLRKTERLLPSENLEDKIAPAEKGADDNELYSLLHDAIETLDDKEKVIIKLHYFYGHKHREIADEMNLPVGSVSSVLIRARGKLRKKMKKFE